MWSINEIDGYGCCGQYDKSDGLGGCGQWGKMMDLVVVVKIDQMTVFVGNVVKVTCLMVVLKLVKMTGLSIR